MFVMTYYGFTLTSIGVKMNVELFRMWSLLDDHRER